MFLDLPRCCVRACGARPRAGLLRAPACGRRRCRLPPSPRRVPSVAGRSGAGDAAVRRGSARDAQAARRMDPDARGAWTCDAVGPETVEKSNRGAPPPPIHTAPRFCVLPVLLPFLAGTAHTSAVENGSCRVQARNWQKQQRFVPFLESSSKTASSLRENAVSARPQAGSRNNEEYKKRADVRGLRAFGACRGILPPKSLAPNLLHTSVG